MCAMQMQVQRVGNEIAVNAPSTVQEAQDLKSAAGIIFNMSPLTLEDGYLVNAKGGHFSPFGHGNGIKDVGRIATNAQIDKSLCKGMTTINTLVDNYQSPSRNCDRNNMRDLEMRPELSNVYHDGFSDDLVMNHLAFLSGKGNGKNTLQKRLIKVMPSATLEQLNEAAMMIHKIAAPLAVQAERVFNSRHGTKKHAIANYVEAGKLGTVIQSMTELL